MMGGGRRTFLPQNETDPETHEVDSKNGRLDGRNLVNVRIFFYVIDLLVLAIIGHPGCLVHILAITRVRVVVIS